ncbi:MAG: hypothetical protein D3923_16275, partial [Candidatus Electrothrix sp. AR3]|nr:hypothetical protein [Candidatus Electrothrix sp. AR3]
RRAHTLLTNQCTLLVLWLQTLRQQEGLLQEFKKLDSQQEALVTTRKKQAESILTLRQKRDQAQQLEEEKRIQVALASRIRELEEERQRLEDNTPCPLCGALDHPYAQGNIPALDVFAQQLQLAQAATQKTEKALSTANVQIARLEQEEQGLVEQIKKNRAAVEEAEQLNTNYALDFATLASVPVKDLSQQSPSTLENRLIALQEQLRKNQQQLDVLEQLDKKLSKTINQLEKKQEIVTKARQKQERAGHAHEKLVLEQQRLDEECRELERHLAQEQSKAKQELEQYGITEFEVQAKKRKYLLTELTKRQEQWLQQQQALGRTEKKLASLQASIMELQAGIDTRTAQLEPGELALAEQSRLRQELAEKRSQLFANQDTDKVEKKLADAVKQEENQFYKDQEKQNKLLNQVELTKAALINKETAIDKRTEQLKELKTAFDQRLTENHFANESTWNAARIDE